MAVVADDPHRTISPRRLAPERARIAEATGAVLEAALALGLACAAVLSCLRLGAFHPATLWLTPWAIATALVALHALPYRSLSPATAAVIAAWTCMFCVGALIGTRLRWPERVKTAPRDVGADTSMLALAAGLATALALIGLAAFVAQLATVHGLRAVLVSDVNVRVEIGAGATPYTIKYIYAAFAAAALAGMTAGQSTSLRARRIWLAVAGIAIVTQYFSTGRSNVFLAMVITFVGYCLTNRRPMARTQALAVVAALGVSTLAIFLGMGSLLGKSFEASDVRTYDNVFVRHEALRPFALPYQYVTAPLPAFDVVRQVTPQLGRKGCVTVSPLCAMGRKLGLPVEPEPSLTGFTGSPGSWNTFTALYAPLADAGPLLGTLIILAEGLLFGILWARVRAGSLSAIAAYAVMSSALIYSTIENTLLQPHLVGAALIAVVLSAGVPRLRQYASRLRPRLDSGIT